MHKQCKDARIKSAGLCVAHRPRISSTQHNYAREETEEDSFLVLDLGAPSTEPTTTSYPITTHTPNTDETRPRPCKRENLKLGAKRSTGKFAGKVPGKFTGDNPAIDLNPALDSVGPNSPTLRPEPGRVLGVGGSRECLPQNFSSKILIFAFWLLGDFGCPVGDFGPRGLSVQYTRTSVCVRQHTQDVRGRPSAHTGRPAVHQYTYQHAPWTVRVILAHVDCLFSTHRTSVSTRRTSVAVRVCPCVRQCTQDVRQHTQDVRQHTQDVRQHTQDVRGCPCVRQCTRDVRQCTPALSVRHTGRLSAHTGRPSAHAGRPSAHAGRPWLSVCVRQYTYQHAGPSRGLISVLIRVLNSYQHADHTYQHAGPSRGLIRGLTRVLIRVLNSYQHADHTYQHAGPSRGLIRVLIRVLIHVLNSYQHADHTYQHAGHTYQHAGPSPCWPFPWTVRVLIRVLIRVLNSYQHADHTYQHAAPSRGLSVY
ncbi:hypothetical protein IGI04_030251 [Brassica rapa subsp. trilocularis]|uniref:Uncharacterized protein n=1 Tax=Brassica rapa subsp. trilocularis TaxID=1813537 RepID=A0ABQ7LQ63_BRACM|nr:hypothetical protein IGI04_030251 [Brassica rapa subsp. trilocularis]